MATTETRPPPTTLTSEHDPDQPSSGFTPVNGRSPPSLANGAGRSQGSPHSHHGTSNHLNGNTLLSKVNSDYAQQNTTSHIGRKDSDSSNKRRRPASDDDEDADDSTSSASSSKRRTSAQQTRPGAQPSTSNGQNAEPPYTAQRPTTNTNQPHYAGPGDPQWSQRSSHDEHTSEARLMEALAADPHHTSHHMGSMSDSPPEEYHQGNPQHLQHGPAHMQAPMQGAPPMTAAQSMQKQRKRNFANRTKTGCLTCRERKKKCDETKPTCNNCSRGEFGCKGYSTSNPLLKQPLNRDHPPIQAKNGVFEPVAPHNYPPPTYIQTPPFFPPAEPSVHQAHRPMMPPPPQDEHARHIHDTNINAGYGRPPWPESYLAQYPPEAMRPNYGMPHHYPEPPPRDPKKLPPVPPVPAPVPAPQHPMQPPSSRPGSYVDHSRSSQYSDPRTFAQLALQHPTNHTNHVVPSTVVQKSEKEKMINQLPFDEDDRTLESERHTCEIACYNFNKGAADPDLLTEHERSERFRAIVEGKPDHQSKSPAQRDLRIGHVGDNVRVRAPFNCDYGYNIKIGDNTRIGRNCHIMDACTVKIGSNCTIGPDVSFYSLDGDHYPKTPRVPGQRRSSVAHPITIEDDVWIGGRAVILAGAVIGQGATVGANTVVLAPVRRGNTTVSDIREMKSEIPEHKQMYHVRGMWGK